MKLSIPTVLFSGLACLLLTGCVPLWTGSTMQDDIDALKARQAELDENFEAKEKEISDMAARAQKDVEQLDSVLKEATELFQRNSADFGAEVTELRGELQRLRGQLEEMDFSVQKLRQDLQLFKEDVDIRFADGGGASLPNDKDELFKFAQEAFDEKSYRRARQGFERFVSRHSNDRRVAEAVYKMGDTYYQEKQWVSSVFEFQKVLENYSRSAWVDAATFKIGASFQELDKCAEAKVFFESVVSDHARSKWAAEAKKRLAQIRGDSC